MLPFTRTWRSASLAALVAAGLLACGGSDDDDIAPGSTRDVAQFVAYDRPDTHGTHETRDVLVPMRDGFNLTCDLYRPANADGSMASGTFPGVVMNYTAYGRTPSVAATAHPLAHFSKKGYAMVWCNTRGAQGIGGSSPAPQSVAAVQPFSPQEQEDNYDLIEWIAAQPWSSGKVGQIGTSYGGITTLAVAGRQFPPHLKAIIPVMGTNDLYENFAYLGGIKTTGDARGTWPAGCTALTGEATCATRLPGDWAAHPTRDDYWEGRGFDPVRIQVPTLVIDGFLDFWVPAADRIHKALHEREDFALMLGPWSHKVPDLDTVSPAPQGAYLAWFDRWLKDDTSVPLPPKASIQGIQDATDQTWHGFDAWPPKDATQTRLYLTSTGGLATQDSAGTTTNSYAVAADGMSGELVFATSPYTAATTLAGQVKVTVTTTFTATDGNVIAKVFDRAADGTLTNIGYGAYLKASHRLSSRTPSPVQPNEPYKLELSIPSKYWTFAPGHSLQLTLSSADSVVANDAPQGTVTISAGAEASFIDVHLR